MTEFSFEPEELNEVDELDALDVDSPPHLVDEGIELLAARLDDGDGATLLVFAQLCWLRHVQSIVTPDRRAAHDDLDRAVEAYRGAIPLLKASPNVEWEQLACVLGMYADVLQARDAAAPSGDTDLDRSIEVTEEAIALLLAGTPACALLLHRLGDRYVERYLRLGRTADFVSAEHALRAAIEAPGQDPAERASSWMRLGLLYATRFKAGGDPADQDQSIEVLSRGWHEGSGNPLLAMSYIEVLTDRGGGGRIADLDEAMHTLSAVDIEELPVPLQPSYHYFAMQVRFGRHIAAGAGDTADLLAAAEAAGQLIDHPATEAGLRAEARAIRATAMLDLAQITGDAMANVDGVIADLEAVGDGVNPELRRVVELQLTKALAERARRTSDTKDVDRALAFGEEALSRMPRGNSHHAQLSYHVACMLMSTVETGRAAPGTLDRAIDLLRRIADLDVAEPSVRAAAATQLATAVAARTYFVGGDGADLDAAIRYADAGLRMTTLGHMNRPGIAAGLANALSMRYELRGDLADLQWCVALLTDLQEEAPGDPNRHELALALAQAQIAWSAATGDGPQEETLNALAGALSEMAPGNGKRAQVMRSLASGYAMRADSTQDPGDWRAAVRYARLSLAEVPAGVPFAMQMRASAGGTMWLAGRALEDAELVRSAVDQLAVVIDPGAGEALRSRFLSMYGAALLHLHQREPQPAFLNRAIRALEEAKALANGMRGTAEIGMLLAEALRMSGDPAKSAETGREALKAYTWQVLLQSGTHNAMTAAQRSAADALVLARACLLDNDPRGACAALETGRGLVLHAATVAATVPELLRAEGMTDLADEWMAAEPATHAGDQWRFAAPAIPSDLRFRVLNALQRLPLLFDPPSHEALCDALKALDADCLVYLFPGASTEPGLALVVEACGRISSIDLPALCGAWSVPATVRHAVATRDLSPVRRDELVGQGLADVCGAAWDVAIGPLLDHWYRRYRHEPHIVLVPNGALATVPWHAAYRREGSRRWAIDEALFSYIASGRLLAEVAHRDPPAPSRVGLVIGDPDTGGRSAALPGAGEEASTIFLRRYAAGRYCGRPAAPDIIAGGRGTPDDVFGWLDGTGEPTAPVLHLACHGVVSIDGPASSFLLLSDGATVSAEEILHRAARRPEGRSPGLVSLAACTTHTAGRAYDEAVTLSTAFLVAGAATAIGSLWPVPDRATARLMVTFHDNLAEMPPWQALRAAQRSIRDTADDATLADWAGFVHLGH